MPLTIAGRDLIAKLVIADDATPLDASNAHIGAGDSDTGFDINQTDLQASSNKLRKGMEAGYPQRTDNTLLFRSLFGTGDANWSWEEWGLFNAASGGVMLNRKVEALGVKANTQSWLVDMSITITIGS